MNTGGELDQGDVMYKVMSLLHLSKGFKKKGNLTGICHD